MTEVVYPMLGMRSFILRFRTLGIGLALLQNGLGGQNGANLNFSEERVASIAEALPPRPQGIGYPISNRSAWDKLRENPVYAGTIMESANRLVGEKSPLTVDSDYLEFSKSGDRSAFESKVDRRRYRLSLFVQAEGLENQGRFLPLIEQEILNILAEPTWVLPAHDKSLDNFRGVKTEIDLWTAMTAWNLATADYILENRLPSNIRKRIREEVGQRVFNPMRAQIRGEAPPAWWSTSNFNWNAVVHAGVTGAALALLEPPEDRALFAAEAEKNIHFYLDGFKSDGYAVEGLAYWNYGFGHFVLLAETLYRATEGRIDLYASDRARLVARFPQALEVLPGMYPAFGDCALSTEPSAWVIRILNFRYHFGGVSGQSFQPLDSMYAPLLYAAATNMSFPLEPPLSVAEKNKAASKDLISWFPSSQILVCRPANPSTELGFACKGGNNGESHGHLDLGSYVVFSGTQALIVDPGAAVYSASTFDSRRFENKLLNSYGHSVPIVAGQLQREGAKYRANVLKKDISENKDLLILDLAGAYSVPTLKKLERRFDFDRDGGSSVTVTDSVEYSKPEEFETCFVTLGDVQELKPDLFRVTQGDRAAQIQIDTGGAAFFIKNEVIPEKLKSGGQKARRVGFALTEKSVNARITLRITPSGSSTSIAEQDRTFARIPASLQPFIDRDDLAGAVTLVAQNGKILEFDAVGWSDLAEKLPMRKDTLFWIASMTKPITSTAILMLAGKGKLTLSDPISKYLPEFEKLPPRIASDDTVHATGGQVTIRDLLCHQHGLQDIALPPAGTSLADIVKASASKPLLFEPGSEWRYGNAGMNALGRIVEVVTGQSFESFIQQNIFDPLGMKDTTFRPNAEQLRRLAVAYVRNSLTGNLEPAHIGLLNGDISGGTQSIFPAYGLFSTAKDVYKFYQMLLNGAVFEGKRYLQEATVREMLSPQTGNHEAGFSPGWAWGLGIGIITAPQGWTDVLRKGAWGHDGAFGTTVMADPSKRILFIMMIQRGDLKPNEGGFRFRHAFHSAVMDVFSGN